MVFIPFLNDFKVQSLVMHPSLIKKNKISQTFATLIIYLFTYSSFELIATALCTETIVPKLIHVNQIK